jgi:hypothetical protein
MLSGEKQLQFNFSALETHGNRLIFGSRFMLGSRAVAKLITRAPLDSYRSRAAPQNRRERQGAAASFCLN